MAWPDSRLQIYSAHLRFERRQYLISNLSPRCLSGISSTCAPFDILKWIRLEQDLCHLLSRRFMNNKTNIKSHSECRLNAGRDVCKSLNNFGSNYCKKGWQPSDYCGFIHQLGSSIIVNLGEIVMSHLQGYTSEKFRSGCRQIHRAWPPSPTCIQIVLGLARPGLPIECLIWREGRYTENGLLSSASVDLGPGLNSIKKNGSVVKSKFGGFIGHWMQFYIGVISSKYIHLGL